MISKHNPREILRLIRKLGLGQTAKFLSRSNKSGLLSIHPKGYRYPMHGRGKSSDPWVFFQNIVSEEYGFVPASLTPRRIIDAGANAGYSSRYFAARWPDAELVAIEPDPGNFQMAQQNLRNEPRVQLIHGAIMGADSMVDISNPGAWKYAVQVERKEEGSIPAYSMASILKKVSWDRCDLLKMDIEGAEFDVFRSADLEWLKRVDAIVIELHEQAAPGCTSALFEALRGFRFTLAWRGENLLIRIIHEHQTTGFRTTPE
jgi:FkbM family methyltransferase